LSNFPRRWARPLAVAIPWLLLVSTAAGTTVEVESVGGIMQQPTSHYYLASYGVNADVATDDQRIIGRGSYLERPEFRNAGYADKDSGWFGFVGTKITKQSNRGLYAFLGFGRMAGYVKTTPAVAAAEVPPEKVSYTVNGVTAALEYAAKLGPFSVALSHQTFIGYVNSEQLQAYVAWPFNFYTASLGVSW